MVGNFRVVGTVVGTVLGIGRRATAVPLICELPFPAHVAVWGVLLLPHGIYFHGHREINFATEPTRFRLVLRR